MDLLDDIEKLNISLDAQREDLVNILLNILKTSPNSSNDDASLYNVLKPIISIFNFEDNSSNHNNKYNKEGFYRKIVRDANLNILVDKYNESDDDYIKACIKRDFLVALNSYLIKQILKYRNYIIF